MTKEQFTIYHIIADNNTIQYNKCAIYRAPLYEPSRSAVQQ